jgi:fumarate reductase (CoM/CoB) subunit A
MEQYEVVTTDVLIIGGGAAGARAAIEAADQGCNVILTNKGLVSKSGATPMADTFAIPLHPQDSKKAHFEDIVRVGRNLGDQNLIRALVDDAKARFLDLEEYGVPFQRNDDEILLEHHPGTAYPRNAHIRGGGYYLMKLLYDQIQKRHSIQVYPDHIATRIFSEDGIVAGASVLDLRRSIFLLFRCSSIILATGGYMGIFKRSTASPDVTGDGIVLAANTGAKLVDLEMVQYYPTSFVYPDHLQYDLVEYETFLGKKYLGGRLLNNDGKEFLPPGEPPPRDEITRCILEEIEKGKGSDHRGVYLDVREPIGKLAELEMQFQEKQVISIEYNKFRRLGVDAKQELLEVGPAAHYTMGGVRINDDCETSIPGLYAAGEVAGNLHGANRISGNALTETQVFGFRAGKTAARRAREVRGAIPKIPKKVVLQEMSKRERFLKSGAGESPVDLCRELREIIDRRLMLRRNREELTRGLGEVKELKRQYERSCRVTKLRELNFEWQQAIELGFILDLSELVMGSALLRKETRGNHFRRDHPHTTKAWTRHTITCKKDDCVIYGTAPVIRGDRTWDKG